MFAVAELPPGPAARARPGRFTGHRVQLQVFEGPLDLLLYLVRAHRYDICDIPISDVTRQFIDFIVLMDELDLEYAGDFLVTAASLMAIKSRMLLPKNESANEDEMDDDSKNDPRQELSIVCWNISVFRKLQKLCAACATSVLRFIRVRHFRPIQRNC
jgi:segregation and condensation protein A